MGLGMQEALRARWGGLRPADQVPACPVSLRAQGPGVRAGPPPGLTAPISPVPLAPHRASGLSSHLVPGQIAQDPQVP